LHRAVINEEEAGEERDERETDKNVKGNDRGFLPGHSALGGLTGLVLEGMCVACVSCAMMISKYGNKRMRWRSDINHHHRRERVSGR